MRQLVHATSNDNNQAPFNLWWTETMLKHKYFRYSVGDCLENFLLHPISSRTNENYKNVLVFQENIRYINKYYPASVSLASSAKFKLEYELQNNTFWKIKNTAICHISVALTKRKVLGILKNCQNCKLKGV